jgi:hypothetical protein
METIYIQRSDGALSSYQGLTVDQINSLLQNQGLTGTVIDQQTYINQLAQIKAARRV